jgi:hypothetical protein
MTANWRRAAQNCDESSPEGSSESYCESDLQSDLEDYGLSCLAGSGPCISARNGQRNWDHNGQDYMQGCGPGYVQSGRRNSGGDGIHRSQESNPAEDFESDSESSSGSGLGGGGLSCQSSS